jgi:hypothetical protein
MIDCFAVQRQRRCHSFSLSCRLLEDPDEDNRVTIFQSNWVHECLISSGSVSLARFRLKPANKSSGKPEAQPTHQEDQQQHKDRAPPPRKQPASKPLEQQQQQQQQQKPASSAPARTAPGAPEPVTHSALTGSLQGTVSQNISLDSLRFLVRQGLPEGQGSRTLAPCWGPTTVSRSLLLAASLGAL